MVSSDATVCNGFDANKPCPNTGVLDWSGSTVEAGCAGFDENPPKPPNNGLGVWLDPDENKLTPVVPNTNGELVDSSFDVAGLVDDAAKPNTGVGLLFCVVDAVLVLPPKTGVANGVLAAKEFVPNPNTPPV